MLPLNIIWIVNVLKVCLGLTSDPTSLACRLLQWPPVSTYNLYLGIITSKGIYKSCFGTSIQRKCCLDQQDGDWEALTFYMSPVLHGPGDNFIIVLMDQCFVFKLCLRNLLLYSTHPPHTIPHVPYCCLDAFILYKSTTCNRVITLSSILKTHIGFLMSD